MKKLIVILLSALMVVSLSACSDEQENKTGLNDYRREEIVDDHYTVAATGETFYYDSVDSETVTIVGYSGPDAPHVLDLAAVSAGILAEKGKTVISISRNAFYYCSSITSLTLPETVTSIGDLAFAGCSQIKTLTIPAQVEEIGKYAFAHCTSLTSVEYAAGSKLDKLEDGVFCGCTGLVSIQVPAHLRSIGDAAFFGCTGAKSITIAEGVEKIGVGTFQNCSGLEYLTLPASLKMEKKTAGEGGETYVSAYNFTGCDRLVTKHITVPEGSDAAAYIDTLSLESGIYTITYNDEKNAPNFDNPRTFSVDDEIVLVSPILPGFEFLGWYTKKGDKVEKIEKGTFGNLVLVAKWKAVE